MHALLHAHTHAVTCSKTSSKFFAGRLYKSMKGAGTDEATLTRVMVSRCEVDLVQIKEAFQSEYKKDLYSFIKVISMGPKQGPQARPPSMPPSMPP